MVNHQLGKSWAIYQNNMLNGSRKFDRLRRIAGSSDEYAFARTLPCKSAIKGLYLWATNNTLPALCLHIDFFQSQLIQRNDSVDAPITTSTYAL